MLIAYDPGFGNTKVCTGGKTATIQTAISRPHAIGLAATGLSAGRVRIVTINGQAFAVGPQAWLHGEPIGSLDYSALASAERNALFYAALAELLPPGNYVVEQLVVGLPVPLLQDQAQAEACFAGLRALKTTHAFSVDNRPGNYSFEIQRIKVLAQPVGAYADWFIDADLRLRAGGKDAEAGVLDIGFNTLDLYVLRGGEVEPRFVSGAKVGVRRLLAHLMDGHEIEEMDAELRSGRLSASADQMSAWLVEILAVTEKAWPSFKRFAAVIPTGGGSLVLGDLLRNELARRGAAVAWPEDPITANVRGLWKWYARSKEDRPVSVAPAPAPVNVAPAAPAKRRGRPAKAKPEAPAAEAALCSACGRGVARKDGICTTCWGKQRKDENTRRQDERINLVVDMAKKGAASPLSRIRNGEAIGGARLG